MQLSGLAMGAATLPFGFVMGRDVAVEHLLEPGADAAAKKQMADIALNAARSKGATYADVRIGRYLNQCVFTREKQVQNIANAESYGVGVRVIANGTWGFAATSAVTPDGIAKGRNRRGDCQSQLQSAEGTGAAGPSEGLRRGNLENAHYEKCLRDSRQGEGGSAAERQRRGPEQWRVRS